MTIDWLFWAGGALIGVIGLALLVWALFWDRSKGRRRCPKCWYNMSGTPGSLTCSECGRTVKRERGFFKTKRKWRWAFVALLTGLLGIAGTLTPRVRREGWESLIPTTALVALRPHVHLSVSHTGTFGFSSTMTTPGGLAPPTTYTYTTDFIEDALNSRMSSNAANDFERCGLYDWQWGMLIRQALAGPAPPLQGSAVVDSRLNEIVLLHALASGVAERLGLCATIIDAAIPEITITGRDVSNKVDLTEWRITRSQAPAVSLFSTIRAVPRNPPPESLGNWVPRYLQLQLNRSNDPFTNRWTVNSKSPVGRWDITFDLVIDNPVSVFMPYQPPPLNQEQVVGTVLGVFENLPERASDASP